MEVWRKKWKEHDLTIISTVLGIICFLFLYGAKVLNPTYDAWLLQGEDLTQHYIGWEFYRASSWQFPIGMMDRIVYPNSVSVIFVDSIPVFAVLFKLLSPLLPEVFQYFGWWELLCFLLQSVFAAKLLYLLCDVKRRNYGELEGSGKVFAIAGSLFFVSAPIFLMRIFVHTALSSQWILLAGLYLSEKYLGLDKTGEKLELGGKRWKKSMIGWAVMGFLCGSVHMYYIPMCSIILAGFLLARVIKEGNIVPALSILAVYEYVVIGTVFLLGGLSGNQQGAASGLGQFSFNMNGFFNSMGWSRWFPAFSAYGKGSGEGFSYLGLGIWILLLIGIGGSVYKICIAKEKDKESGIENRYAYAFIIVLSILISASPQFALNGNCVFEIPYPEKLVSLWGIFRASGRFIWPVVYLVMLWAVLAVRKCIKKESAVILLLLVLFFLQIYDIGNVLISKRNDYQSEKTYNSMIQDEQWEKLAEGKEHVMFVSYVTEDKDSLYGISQFAYLHHMTVNDFYLAHSAAAGMIEESRREGMEQLREDTIYIFKAEDQELCQQYDLDYYELDGVIAGVTAGKSSY